MLNDNLVATTLIAFALFALPVRAQTGTSAEAEIKTALAKWTADFNAGRAEAVCSLFAPELRYDFRGFPERGFSDLCGRLQRSLADQSKRYAYALDIREILISGSLAVVRLDWTLSVTLPNGQVVTSVEPGMDVLRKEPDGRWQIIRYIAYEAPERGAAQGQ
jgi:ketosteroid isomerase-like protein